MVGAYFGEDVRRVVDRLLAEQLPDGGWNCEAANGSTRSSFNTTICELEALLELERSGAATREMTQARPRGQEHLLERRLFRRLSTGEVIERDRKSGVSWTCFAFPSWWHYDVLRGLEYLRSAGVTPDERVADANAAMDRSPSAELMGALQRGNGPEGLDPGTGLRCLGGQHPYAEVRGAEEGAEALRHAFMKHGLE